MRSMEAEQGRQLARMDAGLAAYPAAKLRGAWRNRSDLATCVSEALCNEVEAPWRVSRGTRGHTDVTCVWVGQRSGFFFWVTFSFYIKKKR